MSKRHKPPAPGVAGASAPGLGDELNKIKQASPTASITFRVSEREKAILEAVANLYGINQTQVVRSLIENQLFEHLERREPHTARLINDVRPAQ